MNKRCVEILAGLEREKKIKIWREFKFPEPMELKILLKDILEEKVDEKYYLSDKLIKCFTTNHEKYPRAERFKSSINRRVGSCITTKAGSRPTDNYVRC